VVAAVYSYGRVSFFPNGFSAIHAPWAEQTSGGHGTEPGPWGGGINTGLPLRSPLIPLAPHINIRAPPRETIAITPLSRCHCRSGLGLAGESTNRMLVI
jgi:hypothetical protein